MDLTLNYKYILPWLKCIFLAGFILFIFFQITVVYNEEEIKYWMTEVRYISEFPVSCGKFQEKNPWVIH